MANHYQLTIADEPGVRLEQLAPEAELTRSEIVGSTDADTRGFARSAILLIPGGVPSYELKR